jgi:outer membrane protein
MEIRRVRVGLGVLALAVAAAVAVVTAPSGAAPPLNAGQPTPFPFTTLAPLTGETSLPYPAYGTPVPGVNAGTPAPGISATITLSQAEMIGFARSPALALARASVGVQEAEVRLAEAGLLPSLSGSASFTRDHTQESSSHIPTSEAAALGVSTSPYSSNAAFQVALSQLIYDGGKVAYGVRAASSGERSVADTYRRELQTVAFNVATAYYAYLEAERTTQVDLEIVREDVVQEDLVRAQVRAGTEAASDIATAQLPVAQARLAVVQAQGAELSAEAAFANAMGLDANVKIQPVDDAPIYTSTPVSTIPVPTYTIALQRALALRPDYDSVVQTVNQSNYALKEARLGLFPTLTGSANASDNSTDPTAGSFRNSQAIGVSLAIPIYDQGVTSANVASARATLNSSYASLQNTALSVQLNVKQALTALVSAAAAIDQARQAYQTAVVSLQATQAQYRAGVTTLPLLLNAQVGLTQASSSQVTTVYALRQAEQSYMYAIGSNYDTSADIGKPIIRPTPAPDAQGGRVAQSKKPARTTASAPAAAATAGPIFFGVSAPTPAARSGGTGFGH